MHLEPVGGHEHRLRGLVEAVVGAADALGEAARALRRADVDDEIDVAPVDAEIEGRGADDGAELARDHRGLDLPALGGVERAVVEGDGQAVLVDPPQRLKDQLGLAADVDEEQRHLVAADRLVDVGHSVNAGVPGPGHTLLGVEDGDVGLGAAGDGDEVGEMNPAHHAAWSPLR